MDHYDAMYAVAWACSDDAARADLTVPHLNSGRAWASDGHTLAWHDCGLDSLEMASGLFMGVREMVAEAMDADHRYPVDAKAWGKVCQESVRLAKAHHQAARAEWRAKPRRTRGLAPVTTPKVVVGRDGALRLWTTEQSDACSVWHRGDAGRTAARQASMAHHVVLDARKVLTVLKWARPTEIRVRTCLDAVAFAGGPVNALLMPVRAW